MRSARVTLQEVIVKNYDNISNLDIDIKHLVNHLESQSKPELRFLKKQSQMTIEDSLNRLSPQRLSKKLSQQFARFKTFRSESKHRRKESYNHYLYNYHYKAENQTSQNNIGIQAKKLHRFLFQMELPPVNPEQKKKKRKFTVIPSAYMSPRHQPIRNIKKYQNEELPNFIKAHLDKDVLNSVHTESEFGRRASSVVRIKKKSRALSLKPTASIRLEDDKGIRPYVTELRVVDLKNRNPERRVQTSVLSQKIKTSIKRHHQQNIQLNGELCGWAVQQ